MLKELKKSDMSYGEELSGAIGIAGLYLSALLYLQGNIYYGGGLLSIGIISLIMSGFCTRERYIGGELGVVEYKLRLIGVALVLIISVTSSVYLSEKGLENVSELNKVVESLRE